MRITEEEFKRRKMVADAKVIMTEAMGTANEQTGGLYYSEWLSILNEMQARMIIDLLRDDWRGKEAGK